MIMEALFARIAAFNTMLPIAWPNDTFTPPSNHRYLRVGYFPNTRNRRLIDSDGPHQQQGILQVSVYWTKGAGEAEPRAVADAIAAWFPCDLKLYSGSLKVRITKTPDVRDMITEDAAVQIPVIIEFECWA